MSAQSQHLPLPRAARVGSVPAAFVVAGLAIALTTLLSFRGVEWVRESASWRSHTHAVLGRADDVYSSLREAEALQRNYFITGDVAPLASYERARDGILAALADVRKMTADNPAQQSRLAEIEPLARRKIAQLETMIVTRRGGDMARLARELGEGRALTERIHAQLEVFAAAERGLLAVRDAELERSLTLVAIAIGAMTLAASTIVAFAAYRMHVGRRAALRSAREIQALNHELGERALRLEAANRELEAFSYSVSHDLRAPLRHVQGYVELLERHAGDQLAEKPRRYLKTISDAAGEMGQLIDDLLAFSQTGRTAMHESDVDMDVLVAQTIRGLEMATQGRNIEWVLEPLPRVQGDASMLKQVWSNLLGNAVKYTRPRDPARIEVGARRDAFGQVEVHVKDNGVGFDMAHAGKLFGVFQRLHRADQFEGTGIGLATVQRILARHGGRIWVDAAPERGATFRFTLKPAGAGA
jgi:signal transduction histidine kinase